MKKTYFFELALVFLMVLVAFSYFSTLGDWNTGSRLSLVKAVVEENRFEIDTYRGRQDLYTRDAAKFLNHYYTDKAIGASMVGMVFYFPIYLVANVFGAQVPGPVFKQVITFLAMTLLCAFLAPLIYSFCRKICQDDRFALLLTLALCFGTGLYTYSTFFYAHSLAALLLFAAFFIWFHIKDDETIDPVKTLISGYLLGYAVITEYPTVVIVLGVGLYILYILWKKQRFFDLKIYAHLFLGFIIPVAIAMAYNYVVFRHPFRTGYGYEMLPAFREGHQNGFMGITPPDLRVLFYMTFHPTMGVVLQSPFLLFAWAGWYRMWKGIRYRPEAFLSFGVIAAYFLLMSGYYQWWGGAAFTPRVLLPVFPFFCIPLAFVIRKWEKALFLVLALIAIVQVFIVTSTRVNNDLYAIMLNMSNISMDSILQQPSTIYNGYLPTFLKQDLTPNLGQQFFHLKGYFSFIPLFLVELLLLAGFFWLTSRRNPVPSVTEP